MSTSTNVVVMNREQQDFLAFEQEFSKNVDKLSEAVAKSRATSDKALDISKKGALKMVWGSLNGNNDKELAQMTADLATSLHATQTVLQVVMKMSHRKNGLLKQFHTGLIDKIARLSQDTRTLDSNQRDAAIAILEEIEEHVGGQLAHHDMVDRHAERLDRLDRYVAAADIACGQVEAALASQHEAGQRADALIAQMQATALDQQRCIDDLTRAAQDATQTIVTLEALTQKLTARMAAFETVAQAHRSNLGEQVHRVLALDAALLTLQAREQLHDARVCALEAANRQSATAKALLSRHALAIAAVILAVAGLLK